MLLSCQKFQIKKCGNILIIQHLCAKIAPYGSYCLLLWSHVSKVFQGTFFYGATIEHGRTTHHPWVNEHPNDSKYGSLTNIGQQQYLMTKWQVLKLVVGLLNFSFSEGFLCWWKGLQNSLVPKYSTHLSLYLAMGNCLL
jgi:hypothetical protein